MEEKEVRLYKYMANRLLTFLENLVLGLGCGGKENRQNCRSQIIDYDPKI